MKDKVLAVLNEPSVQTINFALPKTFPMNGIDFKLVIKAIENGTIRVEEGGVPAGMAKYTAQDDGDSKANTMYLGQNNTSEIVFKSLMVHEAVHAIYDLKRMTIPWLDNEVIAYVSQGFYLNKHGYSGGLSQEAKLGQEIATNINEQAKDPFWLDALIDYLRNDDVYKLYICKTFVGDG